ncbi:hypothetical protein FKW77_001669 [Venturia effusa]|uniref:Uncharacterized protein n=1 Tax=Venturia effusa TaxID=50376 RepID=A0A517LI60_9PEZI|nr:hypothetical protein FKW77_001669 [Venturia effusa]
MSIDNHEMEEDMEEEGQGQMGVAWAGMNLREQITGKILTRAINRYTANNLEIYVAEGDEVNGFARYDAYLFEVAEGPVGQTATRRVLENTTREAPPTSPAQALYRLFILTAIVVNNVLIRDFPGPH